MRQSITNIRRSHIATLVIPALLGLTALAAACAGGNEPAESNVDAQPQSDSRKLRIATTLYSLEYFISRVGGDSVEVINPIPPGVEAHDFEPRPDDIRSLGTADLIIYNGEGFEPWIDRALESIDGGEQIAIEASHGLADLTYEDEHDEHEDEGEDEHAGSADPHVWLDPLKAIEQVKVIRDGMSRVDPDRAEVYAENAASLIGELERLHGRFQSALTDCRLHEFVTSHTAFGYLAQRYGLEQVAISGLSPEAEPSPGDLARLADRIEELGVRYVMVEVIVSPRLAETLAEEVGAETLTLHPLESLTADESERGETYFSIMEENMKNLRTALECVPVERPNY